MSEANPPPGDRPQKPKTGRIPPPSLSFGSSFDPRQDTRNNTVSGMDNAINTLNHTIKHFSDVVGGGAEDVSKAFKGLVSPYLKPEDLKQNVADAGFSPAFDTTPPVQLPVQSPNEGGGNNNQPPQEPPPQPPKPPSPSDWHNHHGPPPPPGTIVSGFGAHGPPPSSGSHSAIGVPAWDTSPPPPPSVPNNLPFGGSGGPSLSDPQWPAAGGGGGSNTPPPIPTGGGGSPFNFQNLFQGLSKGTGGSSGALSGNMGDIIGLMKKHVEQVIQGWQDVGAGTVGGAAKTFASERVGDVGANAARGAAKTAKGLRNATGLMLPFGPALAGAEQGLKFTAVVFESIEAFRKLNEELIKSNVKFAEHSAAMTKVEVSMERFKIEMDQTRGARRAESALFHAESVQRLERSFAKWEDAWANIKSNFMGTTNNLLAEQLEKIEWIADWINGDEQRDNSGLVDEAVGWSKEFDWVDNFGTPKDPKRPPRV